MDVGTFLPGKDSNISYKLVATFTPHLDIFKVTTYYQGGPQYINITDQIPFFYQETVMSGGRIAVQVQENSKLKIDVKARRLS